MLSSACQVDICQSVAKEPACQDEGQLRCQLQDALELLVKNSTSLTLTCYEEGYQVRLIFCKVLLSQAGNPINCAEERATPPHAAAA